MTKKLSVSESLEKIVKDLVNEIKLLKIELGTTKVHLSTSLRQVQYQLENKEDRTTRLLRQEMREYHDKITEHLDSIAGDMEKFDQERLVLSYRQSNHTDRIDKLETKIFGKPSE